MKRDLSQNKIKYLICKEVNVKRYHSKIKRCMLTASKIHYLRRNYMKHMKWNDGTPTILEGNT